MSWYTWLRKHLPVLPLQFTMNPWFTHVLLQKKWLLAQPTHPTNDKPASKDDRGDILLPGFWACSTDCIVDIRVTNTDPAKVLITQEKEKKHKYLEPCLEQRRHFTPFVCSTDGLLGREAATFAKWLIAKLATKWQHTYSQVCGYVKAWLSITIVRATHLCLRSSRIPTHQISTRQPLWEDGAGLVVTSWDNIYEFVISNDCTWNHTNISKPVRFEQN
jgi:hypothetical protein